MGEAQQTSLWSELRRRKVVRVGVAYIIGAWLLMQIGDAVFSLLEVPGWEGKALVTALVIGLPIALVLAWLFEISPNASSLPIQTTGEPLPQAGPSLSPNPKRSTPHSSTWCVRSSPI